jgi:hypothetical protein
VPATERVISVAIIVLLGAIGAGIWIKGRHFNPDRYALRTDALKSTAAEVEGKAGTVRAVDAGLEGAGITRAAVGHETAATAKPAEGAEEGAAGSPSVAIKGEPMTLAIAGLKPMSDTEFYGSNNLFEKIDGRAPAYQGFHFQQLRCRSFAVEGSDGSFVDVFEFRFDTPVNAFGMFALERDPKGKPLDFAADGYAGEMGLFFRQGAHYVQIIASDQNAKTMTLARAIAADRAKALPADDTGLGGRRRLPAEGLIPTSVAFVEANALGQAFLKNVFRADYQFDGKKLPFFLMVATPAEAAAAWQSYVDFSGKFGGKVTPLPEVAGAKLFAAESFGATRVIYQREGELGGVFDADDATAARRFVEQYLQGQLH